LDALIPAGDAPEDGGVLQVRVDQIRPNPRQPRTDMQQSLLDDLAASIAEHGVLQPLIVTLDDQNTGYILIAGERRLQAARQAGLVTVPVIVRKASDQARLEMALVENLQRTDLNPLEAAEGYRQLVEDFDLSHDEIANRVGKSRTTISNTLRLLKLPNTVRSKLSAGQISEGHARALLGLPSAQAQSAALKTVISRGLNVRQTEELVRRLTGERPAPRPPRKRPPEEVALEEKLRQALGTRVTLKRGNRGGSLIIHFYSDEELNAIADLILDQSTE
jgi:ParB family chromosome partitioning protein